MSQSAFVIGLLGASDINDRNNRNWPNFLTQALQHGKTSRVRAVAFGYEGQCSSDWINDKRHLRLADTMPDVALLSFFADGNAGFGLSTAASLANIYTVVDVLRAKRDVPIYLLKMWRLRAAQENASFPNLASYFANYATVAANRSGVATIDCYTAWGDPNSHPEEWGTDLLHPLLSGHLRVTIPTLSATLAPLIT